MVLTLGKTTADGSPVDLPAESLRRHVAVLGSSGSGKTVLCKCLVEEAVRNGIPVIAVDPQGDIASLAIPEDGEKLAAAGVPIALQREFFERARIAIFTPASSKGIPLSVNPLKLPPPDTPPEDSVLAIDLTAASLPGILGYDLSSPAGKGARAYLFVILDHLFKQGRRPRAIAELIELVQNPPPEIAEELDGLLGRKEADELAKKLRYLTVGTSSLLFELGMKVDIDAFLDRSDGKVPVNVIYLNSLTSDTDKHFFLTNLLREVYLWMLKHPSKDVQLLLYIDEIAPYIPPYPRNPPPKEAYALLFRQARKYGIGLVATTQNVTDIDYKALGQVNTWCLGRLVMNQDIARVEKIVRSIDPTHADFALGRLPSLKTSEFLLLSPDVQAKALEFHVRWLVSKHTTLDDREISDAMTSEAKAFFERYAGKKKAAEGAGLGPSVGASLRDQVHHYLGAVRKAASASLVASSLGIPVDQVRRELEREAENGDLDKGRTKGGSDDLYWVPEFKFRPETGVVAEVLTIPMRFSQTDVMKRVRSELEGGLLSKKEEVIDSHFSFLPIWKVTAKRTSKSRLLPTREYLDDYYVHARTGAIMMFEDKRMTFSKVPETSAASVRDLDDHEDVTFVPKLPGEIDSFPEIRLSLPEAFDVLRLTFGITPVSGQLALLPTWTLTIRSKGKGAKRTVVMDAATGSLLSGDY